MLKRTQLKPKKFYTLKKSPLKAKKSYTLKKTELKKPEDYELKKQNEKAKEKWEEARQICINKYKGRCIICGKKGTQVHHIHLRSKRKDLIYEINNLVSLCSHDHCHQSTEGLEQVNMRIAKALYMTLEELLRFAETKSEE